MIICVGYYPQILCEARIDDGNRNNNMIWSGLLGLFDGDFKIIFLFLILPRMLNFYSFILKVYSHHLLLVLHPRIILVALFLLFPFLFLHHHRSSNAILYKDYCFTNTKQQIHYQTNHHHQHIYSQNYRTGLVYHQQRSLIIQTALLNKQETNHHQTNRTQQQINPDLCFQLKASISVQIYKIVHDTHQLD